MKTITKLKKIICLTLGVFSWVMANDPIKPHEISVGANFYTPDALRTSTLLSFSYTHRFSKTWWIGGNAHYGQLKADLGNGLNVMDGQSLWMSDLNVFYNMLASLGEVHADLYTSIGPSMLLTNGHHELGGFIGGGMIVHFPYSWLHLKFDLKNYFFWLTNAQGHTFNSDMALFIGPCLVF